MKSSTTSSITPSQQRQLSIARLLRNAYSQNFTEDTKQVLHQALLDELGLETHSPSPVVENQPVQRAPLSENIQKSRTALTTKAPQIEALSIEEQSPIQRAPRQFESLSESLKNLISEAAPWHRIESEAWERFRIRPDHTFAALMVELAFIHGSLNEAIICIEHLKNQIDDFYLQVHPVVRMHLCVQLSQSKRRDVILGLLLKDKDSRYLQPIERLALFVTLAESRDPTIPWTYLRNFEVDIFTAADQLGSKLDASRDQVLICAGKLASSLGHDDLARSYFEAIPKASPFRDEALQNLCLITYDSDSATSSNPEALHKLLKTETEWREALRLLTVGLEKVRASTLKANKTDKAGNPSLTQIDLNQAFTGLNEWLKFPFANLPASSQAVGYYEGLAKLIVAYRDTTAVLSNLFDAFKRNALSFLDVDLDRALWQPLSNLPITENTSVEDRYWIGIARIHLFVAAGPDEEALLWEGRELILAARVLTPTPLPFTLKELLRAALKACEQAPSKEPAARKRQLLQLRIAFDTDAVAIVDIETYLNAQDFSDTRVLDRLREIAARKSASDLECRILLKRAALTHFTTADFCLLWRWAIETSNHDFAWRLCSLLQARENLCPDIRHAWDISGEHRSSYSFQNPNFADVEALVLAPLSEEIQNLMRNLLIVGHKIPEVMSFFDAGAKLKKPATLSASKETGEMIRVLDSMDWLPGRIGEYAFSSAHDSNVEKTTTLSPFNHLVMKENWNLVVYEISLRLGVYAWNWSISALTEFVSGLVSKLSRPTEKPEFSRRHPARVAKWLRDLTPEERSAWQAIGSVGRELSDESVADGCGIFITRLATLIYPAHFEALESLKHMRAPTKMFWDLERFILSSEYSGIRKAWTIASRVPIPSSIQALHKPTR